MSNYAAIFDANIATGFHTLDFATNAYLFSLKSEVSKLDIDNLKTAPTYLNKLSDAKDNDVVKKTVYDKVVTIGNTIDPSD